MALDILPLWGVFAATTVVVLLSVEGGFRLGRYRVRSGAAEKEGPVGAMVAATLALLAFLLTFTFSMSASRFEARRQAVIEESNSIGTSYLRAGLLPEPHRSEIRRLLHEYAATRIASHDPDQVQAAIARSEALHGQLWSQATEVATNDSKSIVAGLFIQTLNETIDLHTIRVTAGLRSRIPTAIWAVLFFVTVLAMAGTGYQVGLTGPGRSPVILALVLTFSGVIVLIADLDRPHEGVLSVSQQSLIDLERGMQPQTP